MLARHPMLGSRSTIPAMVLTGSTLLMGGCFRIPGPVYGPQDPSCLESAVFGDPSDSPYMLPFAEGEGFEVFQTYCGPVSHGRDGQMSIDFLMPLGTEVLAARSGRVRRLVDGHRDSGRRINYMYVEHEDGTSAFYAHLMEGSYRVSEGDSVTVGQIVPRSGSSGTSIPHLHFGVSGTWPPTHPDDLPVNFKNADGPLDERGGLERGVVYTALSREGM